MSFTRRVTSKGGGQRILLRVEELAAQLGRCGGGQNSNRFSSKYTVPNYGTAHWVGEGDRTLKKFKNRTELFKLPRYVTASNTQGGGEGGGKREERYTLRGMGDRAKVNVLIVP